MRGWQIVGMRPHHGVAVPLFSLRSQKSAGIGEFEDLLPLIDWAAEVGLSVLQLLPLNDAGRDASPYNALTAFGLSPIYLSLVTLPRLQDHPDLLQALKALQDLPYRPHYDLAIVTTRKMDWLWIYWSREYAAMSEDADYQRFCKENEWLRPYALFMALKEINHWSSWQSWPKEENHPTPLLYGNLRGKIEFYQFLQYLCYQQMTAVKAHATAKGVFLMGDIPILLSPDSADVWNYPSLFQMGLAAGAPPDMFNKEGQYWGFPLYEWKKIAEEGYHWWRQRLQYAQNFYHIYRIDHIVGFFRIWAIPRGEKATKGQFLPQDRTQWVPEGRKKLEAMIAATEMLPIGEDLGVITPEVRTCMQELALCSTKVMRWEKQWEGDLSYTPVQDYPPLSLTCVSTHDSEPLTLWWENQPEEARAYCAFKGWRYSRELSQEQRRSILQESHRSNSLFHVNLLHEYFALFPELSWPDPQDARINVPGSVAPTNWTSTFRLPLEKWTAHAGLKQFLREQIY